MRQTVINVITYLCFLVLIVWFLQLFANIASRLNKVERVYSYIRIIEE